MEGTSMIRSDRSPTSTAPIFRSCMQLAVLYRHGTSERHATRGRGGHDLALPPRRATSGSHSSKRARVRSSSGALRSGQ